MPVAPRLAPDDPPLPPGAWRFGTTRLRVRWRWLNRLGFDASGDVRAESGWDGTARTWDPVTGEARGVRVGAERTLPSWPGGRSPDAIAWSADGARVAATFEGRDLVVRSGGDTLYTATLPEHHTPRLRFLADGRLLALQHRTLSAWMPDGTALPAVAPPTGAVRIVDDGGVLCVADAVVRWHPDGGVRWSVRSPFASQGPMSDDDASPTFAWVEQRGRRFFARVVALADGRDLGAVEVGPGWPQRLAVSHDGARIAVGRFMAPAIRVWDVGTGAERSPDGPSHHVERLVATAHGPVSLDADGVLRLHDPATGAVRASREGRWHDLLPHGDVLLATTDQGHLARLALPSLTGEPGGDGVAVRLLAVDGDQVWVSGHRDDLIPVPRSPPVLERRGPDGVHTTVVRGAWTRAVAAGGTATMVEDREIRRCALVTGEELGRAGWEDPDTGWALTEALAEVDGTWFVGAYDGRIGVLRPGVPALVAELALPEPSAATALLPLGGDRLAVGYADGRVRIWNLVGHTMEAEWALHLGEVRALVLWEGRLCSASEDTTVCAVPLPPG